MIETETKLKFLSDKKTEELRKKFKAHVENIKLRNDWLEASRRKNYELEHDRLKGEYNTILNKDPNATTLDLLKDRMNKLKDLADKSVKGEKHEIYAKDSTGEHVTAGESAGSGDRKITLSVDNRYIRSARHCPDCNMDVPDNQWNSHQDKEYHKENVARNRHTRAMQREESERLTVQAQAMADRARTRRSEEAARLIQALYRSNI